MSRVIEEHDVTVLQGDAREQLATMGDGSVQCVVTSPPYYGLRDYGVDGQLGLEASPAEYVEAMRAVFADVRRVIADDGVLWLNLGDSYSGGGRGVYDPAGHLAEGVPLARPVVGIPPAKNLLGIPWRVAFALQDDGWTNKGEHHRAGPGSSQRRTGNTYGSRPDPTPYAPGVDPQAGRAVTGVRRQAKADNSVGRNPGDVWSIPTSPFPGAHFATMPSELVRRCILAGCPDDGTVLDPFAGSGTTLKVARSLGRKSVGIELNPDYIDIIRDRIGQTPLDFGASA